jgi:hypothetical protein
MNCVGFNCNFPNTSANGFTDNNHADGETLLNCVGFNNNYNLFFEQTVNSGKTNTFISNVGFGSKAGVSAGGTSFGGGAVVQLNNSWNLAVTADVSDFNNLAEAAAAAAAPRQPDGSLPAGFARLVGGSDLIEKGADIGLPFNGSAPDPGAYEYGP